MHKHLQEPPPKPSDFGAEVPKALDKLVVELMAKARDDRPWDAQAAAHASENPGKAGQGRESRAGSR